jgi:hypothetical protein
MGVQIFWFVSEASLYTTTTSSKNLGPPVVGVIIKPERICVGDCGGQKEAENKKRGTRWPKKGSRSPSLQ